ncbi:MAG: hypothetical protein Q8S55_07910 [Methylococcaceae bacterium]|nr:hypothetical protein [Methylococcaceae bacterium]
MNIFLTIQQTYRTANQTVDNLPELLNALNRWYFDTPKYNYLHPCVIDGKAALVCHNDLRRKSAQAFNELQAIADHFQIYLKEDSRTQQTAHDLDNRRTSICLVLTFYLGVLASSSLVRADNSSPAIATQTMLVNVATSQSGKKLVQLRNARPPKASEVLAAYAKKTPTLIIDTQAETKIKSFLTATYKPETGDPAHIDSDLAEIARYYAKYPTVVDLLDELKDKKLSLKYKQNNWQAQAWGNEFAVDSVTISFDTRVAVKLSNSADCHANPACNISPADALLHELLHAKLMLIDSKHFIEIGGMQQTL